MRSESSRRAGGGTKLLAARRRTTGACSRTHRAHLDRHGERSRRGWHVELQWRDAVDVDRAGPIVVVVIHDGQRRRGVRFPEIGGMCRERTVGGASERGGMPDHRSPRGAES